MDTITLKNFKKQDGLTLVELMIVLSLLGIILAIGYMYFSFGVQAYDRGERRTIAQHASRLTADFISRELRFAREVEINPEGGISESGYRYFYLDNDSIIFRDEDNNERTLADSQADDMSYSIYFTSHVPDDIVIFFILADYGMDTAEFAGKDIVEIKEKIEENAEQGLYYLKTKVQALNLELYRTYGPDDDMIKLNGEGGTVVKYLKPERE